MGEGGMGNGKGEEEDGEKRPNAIVARTSTSNMSLKGGWVSLSERRRKEGNSPYTSVPTTVQKQRWWQSNTRSGVDCVRVQNPISLPRRLASRHALHHDTLCIANLCSSHHTGEHLPTCGILLPVEPVRLIQLLDKRINLRGLLSRHAQGFCECGPFVV